ncbi:MAG: transglutaminase family protein [Aestuariivita sp.]|nr:transglutaminase family protein [Aestuariivita sp.]
MRLSIKHTTHYHFEAPVDFGFQQIRMTPKTSQWQNVNFWTTQIKGGQKELEFEDQHKNHVELFSFERAINDLKVICNGEVDIKDNAGIIGKHLDPTPIWLFESETPKTKIGTAVKELANKVKNKHGLEQLHELSQLIKYSISYQHKPQTPARTAENIIKDGFGVCQDHAHVFIATSRCLGYASRYVSGYLLLNDTEQQKAMHAWAEIHVNNLGWIGFDISNGISPDDNYVRVATGLDYTEAAPITGTRVGGGNEILDVAIEVAQQ